jgi:prophage regulatory protein
MSDNTALAEPVVRILGESEVREMTGLSRVPRWRLERDGAFPQKIRLSPNRIGWRQDEVLAWLESRPRGGV